MSENGTVSHPNPVLPPVQRKIPPPPPVKKPKSPRAIARDTVTFEEAGRKIGCTGQWIRTLVRTGRLRALGTQTGPGSRLQRVVSLEEARAAVAKVAGAAGSHTRTKTRKVPPPPPKKRAKPSEKWTPKKTTGVTQFAKEEIKHFAEAIMLGVLDAKSITITHVGTEKDVLLFDVMVTPRAPAVKTFSIE